MTANLIWLLFTVIWKLNCSINSLLPTSRAKITRSLNWAFILSIIREFPCLIFSTLFLLQDLLRYLHQGAKLATWNVKFQTIPSRPSTNKRRRLNVDNWGDINFSPTLIRGSSVVFVRLNKSIICLRLAGWLLTGKIFIFSP